MNKKYLVWSLILGAAVGQSLVIWLGPKYLNWYFTPPASMPFDCSAPVTWALARMQSALMWGVVLGALTGGVCGWLVHRRLNAEPRLEPRRQ